MSAREVYTKASQLVDLWTLKARRAAGRPFDANADVFNISMDIIIAAAFSVNDNLSTVKHQLDSLTGADPDDLPLNVDGTVAFTRLPSVPEIAAIEFLCHHIGEQFKSRFPRWSHRWKFLTNPALSEAIAVKDKFIHNEIEKAVTSFRNGNDNTRSAMDHILQREMDAASKAGRPPVFHSKRVHDEVSASVCFSKDIRLTTAKLFGYIIAGHDTSSSALRCKYMCCSSDTGRPHYSTPFHRDTRKVCR